MNDRAVLPESSGFPIPPRFQIPVEKEERVNQPPLRHYGGPLEDQARPAVVMRQTAVVE